MGHLLDFWGINSKLVIVIISPLGNSTYACHSHFLFLLAPCDPGVSMIADGLCHPDMVTEAKYFDISYDLGPEEIMDDIIWTN